MKAGELFAGYGGLALAVENVFNAETAWVAEWDAAPSKILAHHWPDTPNHRDVTAVDWSSIEQVQIISGGSPCQDISAAGARKGMTEGTRSNLWAAMREAIATQKPDLVVWENVKGARSAKAYSELEREPGRMGKQLTALGRVLGDLSTLGYDAQWRTLRASDIGAPHQRERIFVLAHKRSAYTISQLRQPGSERPLPRPQLSDNTLGLGALHGAGTTRHAFGDTAFNPHQGRIQAWEQVTGRAAPAPAELSKKGKPQLSPRFSEWLMGLPDGWATDPQIGLTRAQQLKAIGNGVCPQQAATALAEMWANLQPNTQKGAQP
ncbi:MAG: DNA (cytosine-5-)-methyltransferase [Gammaproteobacteria bacterium]|nr:DNA (cytosine-5-)-methyltransferase [Gammaproteobacteria bacterium]